MKRAKWLIILLVLCLAAQLVPHSFAVEESKEEKMPLLSGMFVATELTTKEKAWTQEDWNSALKQLRDVGMETVVLQYTVQYYSQANKVYYYTPTFDDPGQDVNGRQSAVSYALNACKENGMQLYLGLHLAEDMWFSAMNGGFRDVGADGKSAFLTESADYARQVFDDLWSQFGKEYGDVIAGWYLPFEYNNTLGDSPRTRLVEDFYQPLTAHIKSVTPDKRILISPLLYPSILEEPTENDLYKWKMLCYDVWANTRVDIIAPQDGCGWESSMKENLPPYYQVMDEARREAQAVRNGKGYGEAIAWNNPELYSMSGLSTMTMRRFTDNMRIVEPYVQAHVSFSLHSLIQLPEGTGGANATNGAFYAAYAYLAKNGKLYQATLPTPQNLTAEVENSFDAVLQWSKTTSDNPEQPVAGYQIRRVDAGAPDGEAILLPDVEQPAGDTVSMRDAQLESGHTYVYTVYAYDGTGNLSGEPATAQVTVEQTVIPAKVLADKTALPVASRLYALGGQPRLVGSAEALPEGETVHIGQNESGEAAVYVLEVTGQENLGLVLLQVSYNPAGGQFFPDKIEALADGELVNTLYPQRDYGSSMTGKVALPVSLKGASAKKVELVVTQRRSRVTLVGISAYGLDGNVTLPEDYRESRNLVEGQPVTINGYTATQGFDPNAHFRGTDCLELDCEAGVVRTQKNLYKGSYATDLLTREPANLPFVIWHQDGGACGVAGYAADADRSLWLRTIDLRGESFDLTVDLPTPQAVSGVTTSWMLDRDATVFLPLKVEYYGMTQGGTEQLIGVANRPGVAQINFDAPPAPDNCHRTDAYRYKALDTSGAVYTKIIARVYPEYPGNSHFVSCFGVYG